LHGGLEAAFRVFDQRAGVGCGWGCCGWGWGLGGLWLATLPFYYSTLYWDGLPYYYADNSYYLWNGTAGAYESVAPPPNAAQGGAPGAMQPGNTELFAYPKNGQSPEQQARDKQECSGWAATQTGPGASSAPPPGAAAPPMANAGPPNGANTLRAQAACLEGRGYSVR